MIHLFSAKISDSFTKSTAQKVLHALPLAKQQALAKIKLENAFTSSLAGYALLQEALQRLGKENPALADIIFPKQGKPFFPQGPDFNISHAHDRVVCAISTDVQVGIDIEKVAPLNNYQLKNYFNEEELAYIHQDKLRFYEVWTKKEAILKAAGNPGLTQAREIKFYGLYAVFMQIKWHLYAFDWDNYRIAVASSQEQEVEWTKDTLI